MLFASMSWPTQPSLTKTEAAFRALRDAIEEGRLKPGEHLPVKRLMDELAMSPTPIREALRLLQAEGLVVHHAHRGVVVAEYSPESAEEVYRLRAVLEPLATELAVERATDEQIAAMRRLHDELHAALADDRRTDVAERNAAWHHAVYAASGSRYLQEFIGRLWTAIPVRAIWLTRRAAQSMRQHDRIMAAIEQRDARRARDLMREHIEVGAESTVEHLRTISRPDGDDKETRT
jgi:DNA-binding GntR family transcriptional regulator